MSPNINEEMFSSMSPSEQDAMLAGMNDAVAEKKAAIQAQQMEADRPSSRPFLPDAMLVAGMGNQGPNLSRLTSALSGVNDLVQGGVKTAQGIPGLGPSSFNPLSTALSGISGVSEAAKGLPNTSYGDVGKGVGEALGFVGGEALAGPPGAVAGSSLGRLGASSVINGIDSVISGNDYSTSMSGAGTELGLGAIDGIMMRGLTPKLDPATVATDRAKIRTQVSEFNYEKGLDDLVAKLRPSKEDTKFFRTDMGESIRSTIQELVEKFGFDVSSVKNIEEQFLKKLGAVGKDGKAIGGELLDEIGATANAIDAALPPSRWNDSIEPVTKEFLSKYSGPTTPEGEAALGDITRRIQVAKESFVSPEIRARHAVVDKDIGAISSQINSLEAKLLKIPENSRVGGVPEVDSISRKISELQAQKDNLVAERSYLGQEIENPQVNFSKLTKVRDDADRVAKDAFRPGSTELSHIASARRDWSDVLRSEEDSIAGHWQDSLTAYEGLAAGGQTPEFMELAQRNPEIIQRVQQELPRFQEIFANLPPDSASAIKNYRNLKREAHLLYKTEGLFKNLSNDAALGPGSKSRWRTPGVSARITPGGPRISVYDSLKLRESPTEKTLNKQLGDLSRNFATSGRSTLNVATGVSAPFVAAMRQVPRTAIAASAERSVEAYSKSPDSIKNLQQSIFLNALKQFGIPEGSDLAQVPPQIQQQAQQEAQMMTQWLSDAQAMGDENDQAIALTKIAKLVPEAFPRSKSGIAGEVTIGGERKLMDPTDRAKYIEKIQNRKELNYLKKAKIISQLNDTFTITD